MRRGDCFQAAYDAVTAFDTGVLCHGLVTGRGPLQGRLFAHAWVEFAADLVYDAAYYVVMPRAEYYAIGHIQKADVRRYELTAVYALAAMHETSGPWDALFNRPEYFRSDAGAA